MALKEYRKKRDFRKTPEPVGKRSAPVPGRRYVIQRHAASRLHYDFRLELDGFLKSWAVPKGPSIDPSVKALAVQVEDHPLDYADFEGVIPAGQYGGGTVMVWDQGTWEPEEGDPAKELARGRLKFRLHGQKLQGSWALARMSGRAAEERDGRHNWLLIKHRDDSAGDDTGLDKSDDEARSVISGRSMEEIASDADRVWNSNRADPARHNGHARRAAPKTSATRKAKAKPQPRRRAADKDPWGVAALPGAKAAPQPKSLSPQLATLVSAVPSGDKWLHELKFDGYRLLAFIEDGEVRLMTRRGNDWTGRFPTVAKAVTELNIPGAILDGEVVALTDTGHSDFQRLQNWLERQDDASLVYYVFDLPYLGGYKLLQTPLLERKQLLARVLLANNPHNEGPVRYSEHVQGHGSQVIDFACRSAMEGVICKLADSPYQSGRTKTWLKVKCLKRQEFVIGGYTQPQGARAGFGSLLLGFYDGERLLYCGNVGTGFTRQSLLQLTRQLKSLKSDQSPFANRPPRSKSAKTTWVKPELVAEIEFTEWTADGMLRHPSFQGLREDKSPRDVVREQPASASRNSHQSSARAKKPTVSVANAPASKVSRKADRGDSQVAGITLTNPGRVIYPDQGLTKLDLARFYESIADWVLPHLVDRPLTLVRCPRGQSHQCFYQKHLSEATQGPIRGVMIEEKGGAGEYVVIDDLPGLISLVQIGVLEIHPWGARADDVERPDRLVFDLDPGESVPWADVIEGARHVRAYLAELGLESFVRTSGGKGLHVVVPLTRRTAWDDAKQFAQSVALALTKSAPDRYIATMSKAKRRGKVFLDYFRNQRGATAVASYSTRARKGAPVATPLSWDELSPKITSDQFTVATLPARLAKLKRDPWKDFFTIRQSLTSQMLRAS